MRCLLPFGPNKRHGTRLGVLCVARSGLMYVMSPGFPTWRLDIDVSMDGEWRRPRPTCRRGCKQALARDGRRTLASSWSWSPWLNSFPAAFAGTGLRDAMAMRASAKKRRPAGCSVAFAVWEAEQCLEPRSLRRTDLLAARLFFLWTGGSLRPAPLTWTDGRCAWFHHSTA
jgi:hypothetical protein